MSPETPALATSTSQPFAFSAALERVGKRLARRQAVAGGQAVAERDELQRAAPAAGAGESQRDARERQRRRLDGGAPMPI